MIDESAFVASVQAAERMLYRVSYGLLHNDQDCLDAVQSALTKAWVHRQSVDETAFRPWLTRIVINECHNIHRKRKREFPAETILAMETQEPPDPALRDALMTLDEKLRLPVQLHYLEGFKLDEIAHILRIPVGTVKWRMSRARRLLRNELEEKGAMQDA